MSKCVCFHNQLRSAVKGKNCSLESILFWFRVEIFLPQYTRYTKSTTEIIQVTFLVKMRKNLLSLTIPFKYLRQTLNFHAYNRNKITNFMPNDKRSNYVQIVVLGLIRHSYRFWLPHTILNFTSNHFHGFIENQLDQKVTDYVQNVP